GRPGNLDRWESLAPTTAAEHGVFVVVAQLVGSEGGKLFPGGSLAVGPDGKALARGPLYDEAVVSGALDGRARERAHLNGPLLAALEQMLRPLLPALDEARAHALGRGAPAHEEEEDVEIPAAMPVALQGTRGPGVSHPDPYDLSVMDLDLELVER